MYRRLWSKASPGMALRACNLPDSDNYKLSNQITKSVDTVARAELALESTMKSAETSKNTNHDEEPRKKRSRSSSRARKKAAAAKAKKAEDKEIKLYEHASLMYQLFVDEKNRDLQKMKKDELSPIVKYLCSVDSQGSGDCVSKYKKKPEMIARIMNVGSRPWTFWFDTQAEEEAEDAVETPPAEAEEGLDGEAGST